MASDLWESRDFPILRAIASCEEAGDDTFFYDRYLEADLTKRQRAAGIEALADADYIKASVLDQDSAVPIGLLERGRRAVGQWPASEGELADRLLAAIQARAEAAGSVEERHRWRAVAEQLGGLGRDVLAEIVASLARAAAGLP